MDEVEDVGEGDGEGEGEAEMELALPAAQLNQPASYYRLQLTPKE